MAAFCAMAIIAAPVGGAAEESPPLPRVLLVTFTDQPDDDGELFQAIRAQLSGTPLTLDQYGAEPLAEGETKPEAAARIAVETGASMLFWVEEVGVCQTFYYIPGKEIIIGA